MPYRATTCRERELILDHILFDHTRTWLAFPDEGSAQCRGHLRDNRNMKDDTHHLNTHSFYDYDDLMIFRVLVGLKRPDIYLTGEEKTPKNLSQEPCPNRGSNPTTLRDRRACYRLLHSGGLSNILKIKYFQLSQ